MRKRKQRNGGEKKIEGELGAIYAAGEAPLRSLRRPQSGSAPRSEHVLASLVSSAVMSALHEKSLRPMATPSALAATASAAGSTRPTRPPRGSQLPIDSCSRGIFCGRWFIIPAYYPGGTTPGSLARELAPQRLRELPSTRSAARRRNKPCSARELPSAAAFPHIARPHHTTQETVPYHYTKRSRRCRFHTNLPLCTKPKGSAEI